MVFLCNSDILMLGLHFSRPTLFILIKEYNYDLFHYFCRYSGFLALSVVKQQQKKPKSQRTAIKPKRILSLNEQPTFIRL